MEGVVVTGPVRRLFEVARDMETEYVAADADGAAAMWTTLPSTAVDYVTVATIF